MIELQGVSKRYGRVLALDDVTTHVRAGAVTGLLGPNGAGKSTLMRLVLDLDRPTAGRVLVDGRRYAELRHPLRVVGAHLGGRPFHPRRSGRQHLLGLARSNRIPASRVDEVIGLTGLGGTARRAAGGYSVGTCQRLGLAAALLGDPEALVLDEPVNGLDTDGVRWVRDLLRGLADDGRAVLVSSHLLSELALVADRVVVLGRGRVLAAVTTAELAGRVRDEVVLVTDTHGADRVRATLPGARAREAAGGEVELRIENTSEREVGRCAHALGVPVYRLVREAADLEAGYLSLVEGHADLVAGRTR